MSACRSIASLAASLLLAAGAAVAGESVPLEVAQPAAVALPPAVAARVSPESARAVLPEPAKTMAAETTTTKPTEPAAARASSLEPGVLPAATIAYEVYRAGVGFAVGRSEHRIERTESGGYRIATAWETSGLAAVLRRVRVHHVSEGEVIDGRLRPIRYRTWRDDKKKEASAAFDWSAMQVTQAAGAEALPAGTLDPVTIFYQYGLAGAAPPPTELRVANGRQIKILKIALLGRETLQLPSGESVATRRLRATEDDGETTELWLAERYAGYPLQISHTDRDGASYRQIATSIRLEPHALAHPPR